MIKTRGESLKTMKLTNLLVRLLIANTLTYCFDHHQEGVDC